MYDDCDKLLDSRIVKLDDAVRSGETLTFGAYLVDIGDPHGESKPIPNPILQRDKTMSDRDGKHNGSKLKGKMPTNLCNELFLQKLEHTQVFVHFTNKQISTFVIHGRDITTGLTIIW